MANITQSVIVMCRKRKWPVSRIHPRIASTKARPKPWRFSQGQVYNPVKEADHAGANVART